MPRSSLPFREPTPESTISSLPHPTYRPEIDGLRMIAVLAVVLYHFDVPGMAGGFAGVDVFFVISGYLIGGILWRDLSENGRLHLARFYIRRVKRLAPAYFAMAGVTAMAAWVVFLPFEFREFGKSLIAATVYLSNVLFWRGEGYFDIGADMKALLHTWSLAVEEQFYILLPLVMLLLKASRRVLLWALIVGFAASFAASVWITPQSQTTAFYLFPFRAWELLAGVLLAIHGQSRQARFSWHPGLSWLGLVLVLGGLLWIEPGGFPGWQAAIPVAGTVLLILNGRQANPVNRALSAPLPVFIGQVSYSLYLWHWPVLVLSKYWRDGYAGPWEAAGWMVLSFGLAVVSWRYVELPFRRIEGARGWPVLGALALPTGAMLAIGALAYVKDGMPGRFGPETRTHIAASADFLQDFSRCQTATEGHFAWVELCPIGPEGAPRVVIWGDSHLRAMKEGLDQAAHQADTPALLIWRAGCPPLFGIEKRESYATPADDAACTIANATIRAGLASLDSVQNLLLVGRWSYYATGTGVGRDARNTIALAGHDGGTNAEVFSNALKASLPVLEQNFERIFVLRQPPEIPFYDSRTVARQLAHGQLTPENAPLSLPRDQAEARAAPGEALFAPWLEAGDLHLIDPWPKLCDASECTVMQDGESWYFDNNHLTNRAARALAPFFEPVFERAGP